MKNTGFKRKIYEPLQGVGFNKRVQNVFTTKYDVKGFSGSSISIRFSSKSKSPRKILDDIVSKAVRLEESDSNGMVTCVTCGKVGFWKIFDCGHFRKRNNTSTRYRRENLGSQCIECNRHKDGEEDKFAIHIDNKYGPGTAEWLKSEARKTYHDYPYREEILKWRKKLKELREIKEDAINYQ